MIIRHNMIKYLITITTLLFFSIAVKGQSIEGNWKTVDDSTGKAKSIVEIYSQNNKLYGRIIEVFKQPNEPLKTFCTACNDDRKGEKIVGLEIITALQKEDQNWINDEAILDPENGKLYDCKIWLEDDGTLAVRGYIGFLYRTQYWIRVQ